MKHIRIVLLLLVFSELSCSLGPDPTAVPAFEPKTLPFIEGAEPFQSAIADLNHDGIPDIAVCGTTFERGYVRLYLSNPSGEYEIQDLNVPLAPRDLLLRDLDADGEFDLATANNRGGSISVFRGDGRGGFFDRQDYAYPKNPFAIESEDLDGNGLPDLIVAGESGSVGILYNRGELKFRDRKEMFESYGPADLTWVDVDRDGQRDLVVPIWKEDQLAIFWNRGKLGLKRGPSIPVDGHAPFAVAAADFNSDRNTDLAVPLLDQAKLQVLYANEVGTYEAGPKLYAGKGSRNLITANLNQDRHPDLVAVGTDSNEIVLYYGTSTRGFYTVPPLTVGTHPRAATAADLNQDGFDDLVIANLHSHDLTLLLSQALVSVAAAPPPPSAAESLAPLVALEDSFNAAVLDFQAGDIELSGRVFSKVLAAGLRLYRDGVLEPDAQNPHWKRFYAATLLTSDIARYQRERPDEAIAVLQDLAEVAEAQGDLQLAGLLWLDIAEIRRFDLDDRGGAIQAYQQLIEFAEAGFPTILDAARFGIDSLHRDQDGYQKRLPQVIMPYTVELRGSDLARMVHPHYAAYQRGTQAIPSYRAFSDAHPRSFRGAYADYFAFFAALSFSSQLGDPKVLHDELLNRHPDRLINLSAAGALLAHYKYAHEDAAYNEQLDVVRKLGERLGFNAEVLERDA